MLLAESGQTQTQICRTSSCSPFTARHWMLMAKSGQAHNWQVQPLGRPNISRQLDRSRSTVKIYKLFYFIPGDRQ